MQQNILNPSESFPGAIRQQFQLEHVKLSHEHHAVDERDIIGAGGEMRRDYPLEQVSTAGQPMKSGCLVPFVAQIIGYRLCLHHARDGFVFHPVSPAGTLIP